MATAEERITASYPVDIVQQPTTKNTVRGTPRRATAADREEFRQRLRDDSPTDPAAPPE
jgi:hypothetical protein